MKKRYWIISMVTLILLVALLLPACAEPTPAPTTPAPTTPAPTTPAPSTPAPSTPAPSTPAPTTPAPSTPAPTTPAPTKPTETVTLKISYTTPMGKTYAAGIEWWASEFAKQTDGRYKIETYPSNTLVPMPAQWDSLKAGVAQLSIVVPTLAQTAVPVSMVTGLPALALPGESWEGHQKMWENWWEFYNTFPEVQHELKDFKMVWPFVLDPSHMVTKDKPVRAPSDFKGMTIGGGGNIREVVTANGGATVSVMPPETYMNLDKGVIDGAFLNWGMCNDYDLHEVLKYYNVYDFEQGVLWLMMNLETWNAMPSGDQEIFDDLWVEASKVSSDGYLEGNVAAKQKAADAGRTIIEPTLAEIAVWEQAADMALQKWMDDAKGAGIDDPLEILERYKQLRKTNLK